MSYQFIKIFTVVLFLSYSNVFSQILGCTDPLANNYDPSATINDGGCLYSAVTLSTSNTYSLTDSLKETSGLLRYGNYLISHNDDTDSKLYFLDTTGNKAMTAELPILNKDWEEIQQDSLYLYLGDFGNNLGNRTDLKIFRILKSSLFGNPQIDSIQFKYSDQINFNPAPNSTNFDCEAFSVAGDSIYLFTKQWSAMGTGIYALPKTPGTYTANLRFSISVQGLITGANYLETKKLLVLSGYSGFLQPFLYLLYDYPGFDFSGGNKRKLYLPDPFFQCEGISSREGLKYYVTNEKFANSTYTVNQRLSEFDLTPFLNTYVTSLPSYKSNMTGNEFRLIFYPNPVTESMTIQCSHDVVADIFSVYGIRCKSILLQSGLNSLNLQLPSGLYLLKIPETGQAYKFLIK